MPSGFRTGFRNAYDAGVYCTPDFNVARRYGGKQSDADKDLECIFQVRVNPAVLIKNTDTNWVVTNPKGIRPYRLIINATGANCIEQREGD